MNKDVVMMLALELNKEDIFSLCLTSKNFNRYVCDNRDFWKKKIELDFPDVKNYLFYGETYKKAYERLVQKRDIMISVKIENDKYQINVDGDFSFPISQDPKNLIYLSLDNFFQKTGLYGYYIVYIDGDLVCSNRDSLKYCFNSVDEKTQEISIILDTTNYIDVDYIDKDHTEIYQRYFEESFSKYL